VPRLPAQQPSHIIQLYTKYIIKESKLIFSKKNKIDGKEFKSDEKLHKEES